VRLVLDTNRYVDLARPVEEVVETIRSADEVFMPFVVLAELQVGFQGGSQRTKNEQMLRRFLAEATFSVIYPDRRTVDLFSDLSADLRRRGTPIPIHDIWVAALTLQYGLTLYARDKHFDHLPQLARI
jgi:tRNA(fMet)-specific endonuclease VapC